MAGINRSKISSKIYKQLEKKGLWKEVIILRSGVNAYKEKQDDLYVCTVKAYHYRKDSSLIIKNKESATITDLYNDKLLVICDSESLKIKQHDYFTLDDVKYKIKDLNNKENIVFDMYIDRK